MASVSSMAAVPRAFGSLGSWGCHPGQRPLDSEVFFGAGLALVMIKREFKSHLGHVSSTAAQVPSTSASPFAAAAECRPATQRIPGMCR